MGKKSRVHIVFCMLCPFVYRIIVSVLRYRYFLFIYSYKKYWYWYELVFFWWVFYNSICMYIHILLELEGRRVYFLSHSNWSFIFFLWPGFVYGEKNLLLQGEADGDRIKGKKDKRRRKRKKIHRLCLSAVNLSNWQYFTYLLLVHVKKNLDPGSKKVEKNEKKNQIIPSSWWVLILRSDVLLLFFIMAES